VKHRHNTRVTGAILNMSIFIKNIHMILLSVTCITVTALGWKWISENYIVVVWLDVRDQLLSF
jgi:hypothetical protein